MSSTKIIAANAQKDNYGTVAYGGNVGSKMGSADFNELQALPNLANKVPSTMTGAAPSGIGTTIVSGGTYAGMVKSKYVGIGYDMTLANYVNPSDIIGAEATSDRVSIMASTGIYTIDYTDWSYMSGIASYTNSVTNFAKDHAAYPTKAIPGELSYMETGATPTNADYGARTL
jgi:hypothetical protein